LIAKVAGLLLSRITWACSNYLFFFSSCQQLAWLVCRLQPHTHTSITLMRYPIWGRLLRTNHSAGCVYRPGDVWWRASHISAPPWYRSSCVHVAPGQWTTGRPLLHPDTRSSARLQRVALV